MKRKFHHPEPKEGDLVGPRYWKSVGELADNDEFKSWLHREFPQGAAELENGDRRNFLKIMAASFAFAGFGLSGCRQPRKKILPYNKSQERIVPGVPIYYSTAMPHGREALPLIVETHDARPTKIEGNPSYKSANGGTDRFAQASILDLYDPDRLQVSTGANNERLTREKVQDLLATIGSRYGKSSGKGLAILTDVSSSPTRARLLKEIKEKLPEAIIAEYDPLGSEKPRQIYHFDKAKRVLSFDYDFLNTGTGQLKNAKDWAKHRKVDKPEDAHKMNRVYAIESDFTLTGAMADHRLRASASQMPALAALILAELMKLTGEDSTKIASVESFGKDLKVDKKWIQECAKDFYDHKEEALVVCAEDAPEPLKAACNHINYTLAGGRQTTWAWNSPQEKASSLADISKALIADSIQTLFILGSNPVYNAPADVDFAALMDKVPEVIHYTYQPNETSVLADTVIAANHYLETWSDGVTADGFYVPVQPMIHPLFEGFGETELLARLAGSQTTDEYEQVRKTFADTTGDSTALAFEKWLTEGIIKADIYKEQSSIGTDELNKISQQSELFTPSPLSKDSLEIRFKPSNQTLDGRYANNGWLMEMPDPMTKLTWDNAINISPKLAKELGILPDKNLLNKTGTLQDANADFNRGRQMAKMAKLSVNGRSVTAPINVLPGLADYTVVCHLGWGREVAGRVGSEQGFNFYPLRTSASMAYVTGATLELTGATYKLANTQEHWSMEGRAIIREANADVFVDNPDFANEMGMEAHSPAIYGPDKKMPLEEKAVKQPRGYQMFKTPDFGDPAHNYDVWDSPEAKEKFPVPQQWGMAIDLNSCTGCNACVIACQSENNIPIVGKEQVSRGREMHWIRLDRYFSSADDSSDVPEDPQVSFMGMACQHCENAPCEYVCPFTATLHDKQGLNVMVYNRCAGTRYCGNNCPYKVRRFNFFDWNKRNIGEHYKGPLGTNHYKTEASQIERMQKNPDVTVRMRGVMEKCTYCVQRIEEAKINQLRKAGASSNIKVPDGTIKVACQQVCPTDAISFGDITDTDSEVYKQKHSKRDYSVLGYLNTRPRTTYLARLRNPNPKMPDPAAKGALSRVEYKGGWDKMKEKEHKPTHDPHGEAPHPDNQH